MAGAELKSSMLLALPDPCLLRVLQCCAADNQRSLFSAARAHSRLHQAVLVLHSITAQVSKQQQLDSVLVYLGKHSQHVNSLDIREKNANSQLALRQLPPQLQLSSLQINHLGLQLQPCDGSQGMLGSAAALAALKQLRLKDCNVLDDTPEEALAAALPLLPAGLEHLCINGMQVEDWDAVKFPADVLHQLQHLQHLTYLELGDPDISSSSPDLQPLQAFSRLVCLRLERLHGNAISSSMLSSMQRLTRLELTLVKQEPGALAGMTQLQHLQMARCTIVGGAAGQAQLLSHLQPLQQLTHLSVCDSLRGVEGGSLPASAYAALTASSKLQHLDASLCRLPAGFWLHMFPAGRQLPNLQSLTVGSVRIGDASGGFAQPCDSTRLVSCCPGLQSLQIGLVQLPAAATAAVLAPLQGLSGLHTLRCSLLGATIEGVQALCRLTWLRELDVEGCARQPLKEEGLLLQLTQLQQLTKWNWSTPLGRGDSWIKLSDGDEPVWQQLARPHLGHCVLTVAQQAAAALG